ncbi:MAG: hypothetical protein ACKOSQ_00235 [Planctomycetaceae bacterium]
MIDPAEPAGPSSPDGDRIPPVRRRPPNYLAIGERRRLLGRFLPAALALFLGLTWLEHTWFKRPEPRTAPPVDTRLETVGGPRPGGDEVVIEAVPEPELETAPEPGPFEPEALGAPASLLAKVRDDTFFRDADIDAWLHLFITLRDAGGEALRRAPAPRVSFSELFGQPRSFRGRLVRLRGTLHRIERLAAPANNYGVEHYWQGWLEPDGGPTSPIVVHCLEVPEGMATGMKIDEPVEVVGYFCKRYAYNAADAIRVAPLVMTLEPVRRPSPAAAARGSSIGTWIVVSMAVLVAATVLGIALSNRPAGRRTTPAQAGPPVPDAFEPSVAVESPRWPDADLAPRTSAGDRS